MGRYGIGILVGVLLGCVAPVLAQESNLTPASPAASNGTPTNGTSVPTPTMEQQFLKVLELYGDALRQGAQCQQQLLAEKAKHQATGETPQPQPLNLPSPGLAK